MTEREKSVGGRVLRLRLGKASNGQSACTCSQAESVEPSQVKRLGGRGGPFIAFGEVSRF